MESNLEIQQLKNSIDSLREDFDKLREDFLVKGLSEEDMKFSEDTRQAQREIDNGEGVEQSKEDFLRELENL